MAHNIGATEGAGKTLAAVDLSLATHPTTGLAPAAVLYVGANATTSPTAVTGANPLYTRISDGTTVAEVVALAGSNALAVAIMDTAGAQVTLSTDGTHGSAAVTSGPQAIAYAGTAAPTVVTHGQAARVWAGVDGAQIIRPHSNLESIVSGVAAITDGSSTSVIASQGASVKVYITSVIISNSSATNVTVDLRDGAAGTVKATFPVPATATSYGGVVHRFDPPLPFSAATAVCADPSAAASTITVTLVGFTSRI
jgi:hypothetical protein